VEIAESDISIRQKESRFPRSISREIAGDSALSKMNTWMSGLTRRKRLDRNPVKTIRETARIKTVPMRFAYETGIPTLERNRSKNFPYT
jgi:hypothetical protein